MHDRLTRTVIFISLAFLGIISLQIFWFYNSYMEKRTRLEAQFKLALIKTGSFFTDSTHSFQKNLILASDSLDQSKTAHTDSFPTFSQFTTLLNQQVKKEGVLIPFKVVMVDSNHQFLTSWGTPVDKRKDWLIGDFPNVSYTTSKETVNTQIAIYLPRAPIIILKEISMVAVMVLVLLLLCTISLIYLLRQFFKQKKIANIRKDFTNNMTHELKTPISSATVALGILKDDTMGLTDPEKKEYMELAESELKRLALLVDKVLKIAAYEKGEISISPQYFTVKPWIESIVNPQLPMLQTLGAKIKITVYPEDLKFRADKANMSSVLQNLLDNSIKYADPEKDYLYLQIDAWQGNNFYHFAVQDNGIGIPYNLQQKIFDKFFRVPTGDRHDTKGYGLGLSYVKEIVDLHHGNIDLESTFHNGTRFKISIPKQL